MPTSKPSRRDQHPQDPNLLISLNPRDRHTGFHHTSSHQMRGFRTSRPSLRSPGFLVSRGQAPITGWDPTHVATLPRTGYERKAAWERRRKCHKDECEGDRRARFGRDRGLVLEKQSDGLLRSLSVEILWTAGEMRAPGHDCEGEMQSCLVPHASGLRPLDTSSMHNMTSSGRLSRNQEKHLEASREWRYTMVHHGRETTRTSCRLYPSSSSLS